MFSKEEYIIFQRNVEMITKDTFVEEPTEEEFQKGSYFYQHGLCTGTEKLLYFYDKQKLNSHKKKLLSLCKRLPKFHNPSEDHAGTISSFDLLPNMEIFLSQSPEDTYYQMIISNHFANLVEGADIAKAVTVPVGEGAAFLIILDRKYRSYMESEDQEPFED